MIIKQSMVSKTAAINYSANNDNNNSALWFELVKWCSKSADISCNSTDMIHFVYRTHASCT